MPIAILDAEILRHGDLDTGDVIAVPQRLKHRVGEPRVDDVLHGLLAQIMVDPENVLLREQLHRFAVQRSAGFAVVSKWLLDHQPRVPGAVRTRQALRHGGEQGGGHREIVQRPRRLPEFRAQSRERGGVVVVAFDITQQLHQGPPRAP
jgi:hypothetical protein